MRQFHGPLVLGQPGHVHDHYAAAEERDARISARTGAPHTTARAVVARRTRTETTNRERHRQDRFLQFYNSRQAAVVCAIVCVPCRRPSGARRSPKTDQTVYADGGISQRTPRHRPAEVSRVRRGGRPCRSRGYRVSAPLTRVCTRPSRLGPSALVCVNSGLVDLLCTAQHTR
eukprot:scaffold127377_cov75-Phaeocystis_antarctica.AAC.4